MYIAKINAETELLKYPDYVEKECFTTTYFVCIHMPRKNLYACDERLDITKTMIAQFRTKVIARIEAKRLIAICQFFDQKTTVKIEKAK